MAGKQVICLGDTTDHGGVVISALDNYTVNGRPVATESENGLFRSFFLSAIQAVNHGAGIDHQLPRLLFPPL
ncbi:TPA: PAAR domain-containing protein [Morganella morganii]|uniref:PAAR domain-containing protein n=1 Tax=Morganella morganii TaxID=582 RepID=UPI0034E5085E